MYALYIVMGASCDFSEENMLQIRRWWCLVLLQNFPMPSEEERLQERKKRQEQKKLQDVAEVPLKKFRLSESATEASDEAENLPGLGTGNRENPLVRDAVAAAQWCETTTFKGKISLPQVVTMAKEERVRAVELLCDCDGQEEEETADVREPFLFLFSLQEDYETFCQEIIDRRNMKVFCGFDRKE
ncbi:uncharacterized protein LOC127530323 isoform X2 [Acanthochromis polyacanthus]|uniref:uncharacterized protein LOC127530323 isoform X2 n=1 Tax=Acanthochromis polyacanthus TaxID=80966 RepID=UPI00223448AE|nr:uncharacterized protein LOC127530323 isoform X2 [Acanthochromis polyacanthus]